MDELIEIKLSVGVLSTLIAGIYCTYSGVDPIAVPVSLYLELTEKLVPYLKNWDYGRISFEEWVQHCLIVAPKEMFNEVELEESKKNSIYIERNNGNVILVATGDIG